MEFFTHDSELKRETEVVEGMGFLHELITFKLESAYKSLRAHQNLQAERNTSGAGSESSESDSESDDEPAGSDQNYVYHKSKDRFKNAKERWKRIALTTIQMISYGCQR
ncbi:uncharacterized protein MELLADRAFT_105431 [Melampsora larici-populina 98AG31]|uniref:Uncharacterized protein n=1 Tax=Melampsora larici-populina (strain 98AG31 / pathotype 3-4-7) TaxID=747676 RepID=F4RI40_MELLP|nr:uncharacterized protein MELLADRAFT_105431 [Melampsora larici-populina 98AG31]EGG07934.1 hypothetical protein MELLADRAFT_105431 [Melampsora larici-populina 98AG31]